MHRSILSIVLLLLFVHCGFAQNLQPHGYFLSDSVKIGEEFAYSLSLEYPAELNVLFPDSTFTYGKFDLERKEPFPTKTTGELSKDSAVYYFTTFEIDSIQFLSLPVYLLNQKDSIAFRARPDSVMLTHVVTQIPDSLALIDNTIYRPVRYQFNYPYLLIGIAIFVVLGILVMLIFGKQIRRRYKGYIMQKRHRKFLEHFETMSHKESPEPTLTYWKKYMEQLESVPYTKMTTREILHKASGEALKTPLRSIDRVIYAELTDEELQPSWSDLLSYSNTRYEDKLNQLRDA